MNYQLTHKDQPIRSVWAALKGLWPLLHDERRQMLAASLALLGNSVFTLSGPALAGYTIDHYVVGRNYAGVLQCCTALLILYAVASICQYLQTVWMGSVGLRLLYRLRKMLFEKLQELPLAFFQENKSGDLISRLNNDTDKVNMFFSQALMQFVGSLITMLGAAFFLLLLNPRLGATALGPALLLALLTRLLSPLTRAVNTANLNSLGFLSAEISDSLENFKVIVSYHRRDYFLERFSKANRQNYGRALRAGLTNQIFVPLYGLCNNLAQLAVLFYGLILVSRGQLTLGLLISFLIYVVRFYDPMRQMAQQWSSFQTAMAAWDRIAAILQLQTNLTQQSAEGRACEGEQTQLRMEFRAVDFGYNPDRLIVGGVNLRLEPGKTYAMVGPTGGGKTTTASLMARLYDPVHGQVLLDGRDLRCYSPAERSRKVGFILQDPFLQGGSLRDNFAYANPDYSDELIETMQMSELLSGFNQGLDTEVQSLSLGQRQIVAFMRAVLRQPQLLVLDEATANIDTMTEKVLEKILEQLPSDTTRVIIAHRLNTIANADEIYFVNQGHVQLAGSMEQAMTLLREGLRES